MTTPFSPRETSLPTHLCQPPCRRGRRGSERAPQRSSERRRGCAALPRPQDAKQPTRGSHGLSASAFRVYLASWLVPDGPRQQQTCCRRKSQLRQMSNQQSESVGLRVAPGCSGREDSDPQSHTMLELSPSSSMAEQRTFNPTVGGSSPPGGTQRTSSDRTKPWQGWARSAGPGARTRPWALVTSTATRRPNGVR